MNGESKSFLRDVIGSYLTALGTMDEKVVIVNADLAGTSRNKGFIEVFPDRAFNVGIAEQNMVSFAAGLAHEGFKPYVFSMAPFLTMRACEQCRTDVAYADVNVKLMGTYSGVSGGISGATHWGIEDCAIMSGIPNIMVVEPCDAYQAKILMDKTLEFAHPVYIRTTCEPCRNIYREQEDFPLGGSKVVREGNDGAIICAGVTVQFALDAADKVKKEVGLDIRVIDMYSIKPLDLDAVISAAKTKCLLVVQDHNVIGGLGSMVAMAIAKAGINTNFDVLGIPDEFVAMAHAPYLYREFGYDINGIYNRMVSLVTK